MVTFLVVRFSSIGDIVLTTPIVRCLKQQVEQVRVLYLTKENYKPVVELNPNIDKVYYLTENYAQLIQDLKKEKIDYIIDLHKNLRTSRLRSNLKRETFSFDKLNFKKWLAVNFKKDILPNIHIVDRYFKAVEPFSVQNDGLGLDYFISPKDELEADKILAEKKEFIALVLGANHYTKQVPAEKIVEILSPLDYSIVLLGGADVEALSKTIEEQLGSRVLNLVGKLSLNLSAAVIKKSKIVITPDTGLMHIAASFKKPIISLWGNTIPEFGMYPYLPGKGSKIFQVSDLACRPCSKIGFPKCPKKHFKCMMDQDVLEIRETIKRTIS